MDIVLLHCFFWNFLPSAVKIVFLDKYHTYEKPHVVMEGVNVLLHTSRNTAGTLLLLTRSRWVNLGGKPISMTSLAIASLMSSRRK